MRAEKFLKGLKGKTATFCGIGRTNMPLIELFLKHGATVTARDKNTNLGENGERLRELGVKVFTGQGYLEGINEDMLFRAPGIPYYLPELVAARANGTAVTSEMEVFFDLCPCKIYAVTGSDGKTTTTSVIAEFLKAQGKNVLLGGNIGTPLLQRIEEITQDDVAVVELSSFQLISMRRGPDVAVVTNLAPNHLDVHKDMEEYVNAKKNVFLHQNAFSRTVLNLDNEITAGFQDEVRGELMLFSRRQRVQKGAYAENGKMFVNGQELMDLSRILIPGGHNVENYLAAVCAVWGEVSPENIVKVARSFGGVAHRAELVRRLGGVSYYNDSIASSPSRAISGTLSLYDKKIIMIAGGADKKVPFDQLGEIICEKVKTLILVKPASTPPGFKPSAAGKIEAAVKGAKAYAQGKPQIITVNDLETAVIKARSLAGEGDVVSLCPACTAFDMYKDFEARGNLYKKIVNELQ